MAPVFLSPLRSPATFTRLIPRSTRVQTTTARYIKGDFPQHRFTSFNRTYAAVVVQDKPRGRSRRIVSTVLLALGSFVVGGYFALSYAPPFLTPLIMGSMPTNEDSLRYEAPDEYTREVDEHIRNHKIAQALRANPDFIESRPHMKYPEEVRSHNLTASTLQGPDKIVVPPLCFNQKDGKSMVSIFYVGQHLCGHPGIIHGGFLATMLDEGLAMCAFQAMPNKVGVTAQLNIAYRKPTMAGQFLALVADTTKVEGRKAWSAGVIVPLEELTIVDGQVSAPQTSTLVGAEGLFIEPKHAQIMKTLYRHD